jgi:hypothetical protein
MLMLVPVLDSAISDAIMAKAPIDVSPFYKQITGYVVSDQPSDPGNLGSAGELFPALRWRFDIRACRLEGDKLTFDPMETITVQLADGLRFEGAGYAIYGGLNPAPSVDQIRGPGNGEPAAWAARELSAGAKGLRMVRRDFAADVMPLVDAATASGTSTAQEFPRILAFNLFGQAWFAVLRCWRGSLARLPAPPPGGLHGAGNRGQLRSGQIAYLCHRVLDLFVQLLSDGSYPAIVQGGEETGRKHVGDVHAISVRVDSCWKRGKE